MGTFRRKVPMHYIEIHPHNLGKNDWIIVLEAWTIVGPSVRVAKATTDRKIVTKYNIFLRKRHYLVLEGYDPRIRYAKDPRAESGLRELIAEAESNASNSWRRGDEPKAPVTSRPR